MPQLSVAVSKYFPAGKSPQPDSGTLPWLVVVSGKYIVLVVVSPKGRRVGKEIVVRPSAGLILRVIGKAIALSFVTNRL